ncbi:hypothetical protein SS50377_22005 [Spironucleus salmonicida]|uniref:Uncharacterized protein n=1 Tax=Spironucleus salmonicida TaxID=348837 RepID=V6LMG8_9EUKA|nr:hypothetical protein SS50377_22005 [Spironucleus salmonicida]|eukprot:EST45830.1 Hypothetical protein SS50377_14405 [Spironucleus salmonicida]
MGIWKDVIRNQQKLNNVKQLPRQIESLLEQSAIRFSTCYTTPNVLQMLQRAIHEAPTSIAELSIEFQSSIYQDKFIQFQSIFSQSSKFYDLINYANQPILHQLLPKSQFYGTPFPKIIEKSSETHLAKLVETLQVKIPAMENLKILSLFNAPPGLLDQLDIPSSLEVLILDNLAPLPLPKILKQLPNLQKLLVLSISNTNLAGIKTDFIQFLQNNANVYAQSYSTALNKHYGPCARHTAEHELRTCYSDAEKATFKHRFGCQGVEYLAIQSCQVSKSFGDSIVDIIVKDQALQVIDLRENDVDLIMKRRAECENENLEWQKYLKTSMSSVMARHAPSQLIRKIQQESLDEAEKYELEEVKSHFLCRILQQNSTIRKIILSQNISECLRQYVQLKCQVNQQQLDLAINEVTKSTDFYENQKVQQEYFVLSAMKSVRFLLVSLNQKIVEKVEKESKKKICKDDKLVDNIRKTKAKSPGKPQKNTSLKKGSSLKKTDKIVKSKKLVSESNTGITSQASTTQCSVDANSTRYSTTTMGTVRSKTSTVSRLKQRKVSGSTFRVDSTIMSNSSTMKRSNTPTSDNNSIVSEATIQSGLSSQLTRKSSKSSRSQLRKKKSVLQDNVRKSSQEFSEQSNLKLKELMKPFKPEEESQQSKQSVVIDNDQLKQKIVDLVYELLMFNCDGDKSRARQIFLQNQKRLMEYVGKLMIDVEKGGLTMDGVRSQLFAFLENAIL